MKKSGRILVSVSFALVGAGFLLPFWPLCVLGILLAAFSGHWIYAISFGVLLDVAYGTPTGLVRFIYLPFTVLALIAIGTRSLGSRYLLEKAPPEKI